MLITVWSSKALRGVLKRANIFPEMGVAEVVARGEGAKFEMGIVVVGVKLDEVSELTMSWDVMLN